MREPLETETYRKFVISSSAGKRKNQPKICDYKHNIKIDSLLHNYGFVFYTLSFVEKIQCILVTAQIGFVCGRVISRDKLHSNIILSLLSICIIELFFWSISQHYERLCAWTTKYKKDPKDGYSLWIIYKTAISYEAV